MSDFCAKVFSTLAVHVAIYIGAQRVCWGLTPTSEGRCVGIWRAPP